MKRMLPVLMAAGAMALLGVATGRAALASPTSPPPVLVGELGRPQALVFQGNQTFPKQVILDGLIYHMDYQAAAHPAAPLADYTAMLERKLRLGYLRCGFPEATVQTSLDTHAQQIRVQVQEGPRFRCGEILVTGHKTMTNEAVRRLVRRAASGLDVVSGQPTNAEGTLWVSGQPVPFDEFARVKLAATIQEALAELNAYLPEVQTRVVRAPNRPVADLVVEIKDAGIKGVLAEIEIEGSRHHSRRQLLDYLELQPGQAFQAQMPTTLSNRLWQSARFLKHEVTLARLPEPGRFKLQLLLEDLDEAPPLAQALSPEETTMLRFRDWLERWEKEGQDLVCSLNATSTWFKGNVELVLSPSGLAVAARTPGADGAPRLAWAAVGAAKSAAWYSPWRQRKLVGTQPGGHLQAFLRILPLTEPTRNQRFNLSMGAGFSAKDQAGPFHLELQLAPVVFLGLIHEKGLHCETKQGVLTADFGSGEDGDRYVLRLEADTGRLLSLEADRTGSSAQATGRLLVRAEPGAYQRLAREAAAATAAHTNEYVPEHGASGFLAFLAQDLLAAEWVEPLLKASIEDSGDGGPPARSPSAGTAAPSTLAQVRLLLNQQDLRGVFAPFENLHWGASEDVKDTFDVPWEDPFYNAATRGALGMIGAVVLQVADGLLPRGSWPWTLLREAALVLAGQTKYAQVDLDKLLQSDAVGPAGCLATATLLGKTDVRQARVFAQRGLANLSTAAFQKDLDVLFATNAVAGQVAANLLGLLGHLEPPQVEALTAKMTPESAALVRQTAGLLHDARPATAAAAWPAVAQHWTNLVRPPLERSLQHFLPQAQFLTDRQALYRRGQVLVAEESVLKDYDEAAQCFRKAAAQGHAGAQLQLGLLYKAGQGVPVDFSEAMRWLQKARAQKEPHAACNIAQLYLERQGVDKNLDEAARWFRLGAEENCPRSEFSLGQILEAQRQSEESLTWYRRAAEHGAVPAQVHLGDILSDGISAPPDYPEACQWLLLAAEKLQNNKLLEVRLRRVLAKLTSAQEEEARRKAEAISARLKKQEQDRRKAAQQ